MLETLAKGFRAARERLTGVAELTEDHIEEALRDVRMSLLEADVAFSVTKSFLQRVRDKAVGQVVQLRAQAHMPVEGKPGDQIVRRMEVTPEHHFIRICHEELVSLMGPVDTAIHWAKKGPTVIMVVGLQGSGKTTTVGKLARWLERQHRKRSLLVAADVYRPAAVQQLQVIGDKLGLPVFTLADRTPPEICEEAYRHAYTRGYDVVLLDTAGRLAIDEPLMRELEEIKARVRPQEVFFVCDAMIGQDAVNTAKAFHDRIATTGFILTKLDGDARGGAALSIKEVTGQPIKFLGVGEGLDRLEEFRPDGLAGRILGMGDIVGLMKDFEQVVDAEKAEADALRMLKGKFDMQDFLDQIGIIQQMGSLKDLLEKMPFIGAQLPPGAQIDDRELVRIKAMISSMTADERRHPERFIETSWEQVIAGGQVKGRRRVAHYAMSRIRRVARGSGRKEHEVIELLHKFALMRQMMLTMGAQTGLLGKIPGLRQLAKIKQLAGMDLGAIMNAAGMQPVEPRHSAPRVNLDRAKEKRKRKAERAARKSNKKKKK
ncbi:MAG: signal recognition particle receptor subunit alpha [Myxococcales bacterium]|nr:signal recognition particle protein Srp54 [Myxococcota bacterium]MDW8281083.1 signal recognition particle receptor subunit alpha [Myxococcales bacterium]